jgi:hypothetical protein
MLRCSGKMDETVDGEVTVLLPPGFKRGGCGPYVFAVGKVAGRRL